MRIKALLSICLTFFCVCPTRADEDLLVGIRWTESSLVSFDPALGATIAKHLQLNPYEAFRGLTYDKNHHALYALAQVSHNLYRIDTDTLTLTHIGNLRIDHRKSLFYDAGALAYDPTSDTLFTAIERWDTWDYGGLWSELCAIDPSTAALTAIGRIDGPFIDSLAFNGADGYLYGLALYGSGSWDSPYKAHVVRIDPKSAEMETLFETPYHTMMGMAFRDPATFFSWVNWTSHFYARTDMFSATVSQLGDSDPVGAISAIAYKDFSLPEKGPTVAPRPASFAFRGHVTSVWDPGHHLGGDISPGSSFSGRISFDITAPYRDPDPNFGGPYSISVNLNGQELATHFLRASVVNNYYSSWGDSLSDSFQLYAQDSEIYSDRLFDISWVLTDPTATALSNNDLLPSAFDLAGWAGNTVVINRYAYYDRSLYSILGTIDFISPRQELLDPGLSRPGGFPVGRPDNAAKRSTPGTLLMK